MEKLFTENLLNPIIIKITEDSIFFYHQEEILNHSKFIKSLDGMEMLLTDEEKEIFYFYHIHKSLWTNDFNKDNAANGHN